MNIITRILLCSLFYSSFSITKDMANYLKNNGTLLRINNQKTDFTPLLEAIEHPEKIKHIDFSHNTLTTFDFNSLKRFSNLEKVWLNHNNLEKIIPLQSDDNLPSLFFINLMHNRLTYFSSTDFQGLPALQELWLNHNLIETLNITTPLVNLRELHMAHNRLQTLDLSNFILFPYLYILNFSFNGIESLKDCTAHLPHLEVLFLDNNNLVIIPQKSFNNIESLKIIYLHDNKINYLHPECFSGVKNLVQLFMYNNEIEEIEEGTFNDLENLHILYLRNNRLRYVTRCSFQGLTNLHILDIAHNYLTPAFIWLCTKNVLPSLKELYFHNNYSS